MIRSMKHIEKQLNKKVLVNRRPELDEDTKGTRKKKFHQFLKSTLRIDTHKESAQDILSQDRVSSTFEYLLTHSTAGRSPAQ